MTAHTLIIQADVSHFDNITKDINHEFQNVPQHDENTSHIYTITYA
jgi:hypothetical protein